MNVKRSPPRHRGFVDVVQDRIGMPEGAWCTTGSLRLTSVDTALCVTLAAAMDIVINDATALRDALTHRAEESVDLPIVGRTHGVARRTTT